MPITPQTTIVTPNTVYVQNLTLGMAIQNGQPVGVINVLVLAGAHVDSNTGAWEPAVGRGILSNLTFTMDNNGNIQGLPDDLAAVGPTIAAIWGNIVSAADQINTIRKLV